LRRIFDFGPESAKTLEWVADDAVLCELLSVNLSTCQPVDTQAAVDKAAVDASPGWYSLQI
jgi:hypothetical protein